MTLAGGFVITSQAQTTLSLAAERPSATSTAAPAATSTSIITPDTRVDDASAPPPAAPVEATTAPADTPAPAATTASLPVATAVVGQPASTATVPPPAAPPTTVPTTAPSATPRPPTATPIPPATATPTKVPAAPAPAILAGMEQSMFSLHNSERSKAGLGGLELDGTLVAVARARAQDMAANNYFAHTSPTGETAFTLMNAANVAYSLAGENIARNNYPDAQAASVAMTGFMNSPGHRANILDARFKRVGIGVATGSDGMKYFAVVFAD